MNEEILIGRARPGDAAQILDLVRLAFGEYRGLLEPESSALRETVDSLRQALASHAGLMARAGSKPVGCLIAEPRGEAGVYLGRLAVDPAFRGRGVAARLIEAAEAWARSEGRFQAELNVRIALPGNIRLFRRLGYLETGRRSHPGFVHPTYLVMEKSLI